MKTSSAKQKGKRLCNRIRAYLLQLAPELEPDDIRVPTTSAPGADIQFSPKAKKIWPLAIECKNTQALNIWAAIKQAENHAADTELVPVVFFSRNHSKDYVALEAEFFLQIFRKGNGT